MRKRLASALIALLALAAPARAWGDDNAPEVPFATPREGLIPGTPGMPGGIHLMVNGFAQLQNTGLPNYRIDNHTGKTWNAGATYPLVTDDWAMAYGRDSRGYVEGLLMLDFEPLTVGPAGYPEIGQSGEGLWDAQHAHQFLHQAMVAFHPLAGLEGWHPVSMHEEGKYDLSLFGGQGSATIGPPIFMHRASSPGPTVPRKHHKGENPHETFPVLGASLRFDSTWIEASIFSGRELTPEDSRLYPHVAPPASYAVRIRHNIDGWLEFQLSGERLVNQGSSEPDALQGSASLYGWGFVGDWRLDGLVDYAIDRPDATATKASVTSQAILFELAARTPSRRQTMWMRTELNQVEEPPALGGFVSAPWLFQTLGFEQVLVGGARSGVQVGVFGEGTLIGIPTALASTYGADVAVTVNLGLHVSGMWMLDGGFNRMHHAM